MDRIEEIGNTILGCAIKVHSHLGPGLLESAYQKCLAYELKNHRLDVQCEILLPIRYENLHIDVGYRIDMVVEDAVLVENKAVDRLSDVHDAQLLTYLKLSKKQLGYLLNWNVVLMKDGIRRMVNHRG